MALGTTDISTDIVKAAIGSGSDDVGTLCNGSMADENVPAFYVEEYANNGGKLDGELILGSKPKWNIWSIQSPGEFAINESGFLMFRLKRNPYGTTPAYIYQLHSFRGYNHTASKPTLTVVNVPLKVHGNAIQNYIRFNFEALYGILLVKFPTKTHIKFEITVDGVSKPTQIIAIPEPAPEGDPNYIDLYLNYSGIINFAGNVVVKISFTDATDANPVQIGDLLKQEIYGSTNNGKTFPYVDNFDGAWVKQAMFNGVYSDTYSTITGTVVAGPNIVLNGKVLIPTGSRIDTKFVSIEIVKKSGSYTSVSFDLTFNGAYTTRITRSLVNGTIEHEPATNNTVAVDGAEHYYTITNVTYS